MWVEWECGLTKRTEAERSVPVRPQLQHPDGPGSLLPNLGASLSLSLLLLLFCFHSLIKAMFTLLPASLFKALSFSQRAPGALRPAGSPTRLLLL